MINVDPFPEAIRADLFETRRRHYDDAKATLASQGVPVDSALVVLWNVGDFGGLASYGAYGIQGYG